jgi:hypothetical protein
MVAEELDKKLVAAISAGGNEPDIVRRYVDAAPSVTADPLVSIRAKFIHQRPFVFFLSPTTIADRKKCELGDILYVYKELDTNGNPTKHQGSFLQVKKGMGSWSVEPHQFGFLSNIKRIQFRFGNSIYARGCYTPRIYNGLPHRGKLAHYLLLSNNKTLCYCVSRMRHCQPLCQHPFSIRSTNAINCRETNRPLCPIHDSHCRFLSRFCTGEEGAHISGKLREVIELVYKRIGWVLDPPEEFADNFIEDPRGFAVLEVTRRSNQDQVRAEGG